MLVSPDLERRWILFVHHALDELLAVFGFASSLEVIDMSAQNEHYSFGHFIFDGLGWS